MQSLIIGKNGILGDALHKRIGGLATTRWDFDLKDKPEDAPCFQAWYAPRGVSYNGDPEVVYIVAAMSKFRDCELNPDAWSINVDGPIRVANFFKTSFVVYISSEAAEWGRTSYSIQKAHAELGLLAVCGYERLAIVRPSKITPSRLNKLVEGLEKIGKERSCGIHRFV